MYTFPDPPSSAGHPYNLIVPFPPVSFNHSFTAIAAAEEPVPNKWWPQACPEAPPKERFVGIESCDSPGNASYSAMIPITGFPCP